jgi:hypothetical protein
VKMSTVAQPQPSRYGISFSATSSEQRGFAPSVPPSSDWLSRGAQAIIWYGLERPQAVPDTLARHQLCCWHSLPRYQIESQRKMVVH